MALAGKKSLQAEYHMFAEAVAGLGLGDPASGEVQNDQEDVNMEDAAKDEKDS